MKISEIYFLLLVSVAEVPFLAALTNPSDVAALQALKNIWSNFPPNWVGADPCGSRWDGISCSNNRVVSITLASMRLTGTLSSDIIGLDELRILDLSYNTGMTGPLPAAIGNMGKLTNLLLIGCGFSGPIPPSIGSLQQLVYLSLNSNNFNGEIPPSLGRLSSLYWLDLADNKLSGSIPISTGSTPGLDWLVNTKHFHFGNNQLSGQIPFQLFRSEMKLIHLLLENNQLSGTIPSSLGLVQDLEVVRLDHNLIGGSLPESLNNLTHLRELNLANNMFNGSIPDLGGLNSLYTVDISNNSFESKNIPVWLQSLQSLTTIIMDNTKIQGTLPMSLFSLFQLQTVSMKNNNISGILDIGSTHSSELKLVDLRNNSINAFTQRPGTNVEIILVDNPACANEVQSYCSLPQQPNSSYSTPQAENCTPTSCASDMVPSPTCKCGYPYTGTLYFRAPSFSDFGNSTLFASLQIKMLDTFMSNSLPVDSVSLSDPTKNINSYLVLNLKIFPSGQEHFNHSGISMIAFMLSNQIFKPPPQFGPYYFIANSYPYFNGVNTGGHNTAIIIGAAVGGAVLFLLLTAAAIYAVLLKRRATKAARNNDPFASWKLDADGGVPQLRGAKCFSFEELKRYTNDFSETNELGSGGYGKVYRGTLPNGQLAAIKRARQGSIQGALEFKTEIELLTRVHHKNIVGLLGFCFEKGEQMLIYEYIANGTLKDGISGASGFRLDWTRRLQIALGAARGIQYLHELANPPIIHRDIKSNNILLDERLTAKVADFGLSKPLSEYEQRHVTTQVKGTMGYMDPEYYMTHQLTEKSDVYSFGILLLELLTSRSPIQNGKYIVREVKQVMDTSKNLYNLGEVLDPTVASNNFPKSIELLVDLALRCVQESSDSRPSMGEVVKEIENIIIAVGLNPHAESASTSSSYDGVPKHPYSNESLFFLQWELSSIRRAAQVEFVKLQ